MTSEIITETVVDGLGIIWGMTFLPNGDMLLTEKTGKLYRLSGDNLQEVKGVPEVYVRGQGGLLDVALHPDYENNGWIYISYAKPALEGEGGNTAIVRAKLQNDELVEQEELFKAMPNSTEGRHFGSRITFDEDGYLYFSVGERGKMENAQNLKNDCGKIHRLHDDGRVPDDNPFTQEDGEKSSIFAYGNRNPQGLIWHPELKEIWAHEHGPKGGDELNVIKAGANYGWPVISYGIDYDGSIITEDTTKVGMEQPLHYWTPSIAPCGMALVTSDIYPGWKNSLLVGSLSFRYLERLQTDGRAVVGQEKLLEGIGRVRNVKQGPDGYIYISVESPGRILKLVPKSEN
ncbi:PQQ-dependent sugar dehydrogenase [Limibacter armeniacum]|uniref:PQQ-dependent sugar dehydrogenase n=1 Tax=Limibacter armeniacum TaxID=466084 RepID=UPI002FE5F3A8